MKICNVEVYGIIYKITNKKNGKVYIGQTTRKNGFNDRYQCKGKGIERVYNFHLNNKNKGYWYNKHLLSSINKYGLKNFSVIEVYDKAHSQIELDELEIKYINKYKSNDKKYGYNNEYGGSNGKRGIDSVVKIKFNMSTPLYCVETREIFISGKDVADKLNIHASVVTNSIKSKGVFARTINGDKYTFEKVSGLKQKPVICLNNYNIYFNAMIASRETGIGRTLISKCCNGSSGSAGRDKDTNEKLVWRFLIDMYENK